MPAGCPAGYRLCERCRHCVRWNTWTRRWELRTAPHLCGDRQEPHDVPRPKGETRKGAHRRRTLW